MSDRASPGSAVLQAIQQKREHVPFRNSKLTLALTDALTQHSKVAMIANVAPDVVSLPETRSTLAFAKRSARAELGQARPVQDRESGGASAHSQF